MKLPSRVERRAVVVGGSMVGLAVARALSETFSQVVVVERDELASDVPTHRRFAPQSYHIHNLTIRGQRELEDLFPGFVREAVRLGALQIDHGLDVARCTSLGFQPQFESGYIALSATRALLEFAERKRFRRLVDNAIVLERTRVTELVLRQVAGRPCAVGVRTDSPDYPEIRADLIVDCSGRSAQWKKWFSAYGLPRPKETVVDSDCAYSSCFVKASDRDRHAWKALTIDAAFPEQPHWGVIVPLERGEWVVTLGGFNGQHPPTDEAGFRRFSENLLSAEHARALRGAEVLTPIRAFRGMEMRWNHFERGAFALDGLLVLGDAAFAYNPLYGQGMSIGATMARMLRDELRVRPSLRRLADRLYPRFARFAFPYWQATALNDLRWRGTRGTRPKLMRVMQPLAEFVLEATHHERALMLAILGSVHLLAPPSAMLRSPRVWWALARHAVRTLVAREQRHAPTANQKVAHTTSTRLTEKRA